MKRATLINSNLALLLLAALSGCGGGDGGGTNDNVNAIQIGGLTDETTTSLDYMKAMSLAVTQMNAALAQEGSNVRFNANIVDSRSDAALSKTLAADLITNKKVKGLVTDVSADTISVNQLNYGDAAIAAGSPKVPITCYACSSSAINKATQMEMDPIKQAAEQDGENWLFREFFDGKYEANAAVQIMLNESITKTGDVNGDGNFKVVVYASDDAFGTSSTNGIKAAMDALVTGPHSVEVITVNSKADPTTYDWTSDFGKIMDNNNDTTAMQDGQPDAVYLAVLSLLATGTVKAYHAAQYTTRMYTATAFRRDYILRSIPGAAEGVEGDSPRAWADDESGTAFQSAFQAQNGTDPEMLAAGAYDSTMTLLLATVQATIDQANPADVDPAAIRDQLLLIQETDGQVIRPSADGLALAVRTMKAHMPINYVTASGTPKWDSVGNAFPQLIRWKVENDKFVEHEAYDCADIAGAASCTLVP